MNEVPLAAKPRPQTRPSLILRALTEGPDIRSPKVLPVETFSGLRSAGGEVGEDEAFDHIKR